VCQLGGRLGSREGGEKREPLTGGRLGAAGGAVRYPKKGGELQDRKCMCKGFGSSG